MMKPTAAYIELRVEYNSADGIFTWKHFEPRGNNWNAKFSGKRAGAACGRKGRRQIMIDLKFYPESHVAWLLMKGVWPLETVDHIDRNPANNRWKNLREATTDQQAGNKGARKDSVSGFRGVRFNAECQKWSARICVSGRQKHLGMFASKDAACAAYHAEALKRWGSFVPERKSNAFLQQAST